VPGEPTVSVRKLRIGQPRCRHVDFHPKSPNVCHTLPGATARRRAAQMGRSCQDRIHRTGAELQDFNTRKGRVKRPSSDSGPQRSRSQRLWLRFVADKTRCRRDVCVTRCKRGNALARAGRPWTQRRTAFRIRVQHGSRGLRRRTASKGKVHHAG
jgi:hypothetical protein